MYVRGCLLALAILSLPLVLAQVLEGEEAPPDPPGDAHFVDNGVALLDETDLIEAEPLATDGGRDHVVTISLAKPLLGEPDVEIRWSTDSSPPGARPWRTMTFQAEEEERLLYAYTLELSDLGTSLPAENVIRMEFLITNGDYEHLDDAGGTGYRFLADSQAPRIGTPLVNGASHYEGPAYDSVDVQVSVVDASSLQAIELRARRDDGAVAATWSMVPSGQTASLHLAEGWQLEPGQYTLESQAGDVHGHTAVLDHGQILDIGLKPRLHGVKLNGEPQARLGPGTPLEVTVQADNASSLDEVVLHLKRLGQDHDTQSMTWTGTEYRAMYPAGTGLADGSYTLHVTGTYYEGQVHVVAADVLQVDSMAPELVDLTWNQAKTATVAPHTPLSMRLLAPEAVQAQITILGQAGKAVASYELARQGDGSLQHTEPTGVQLSEGTYRARVHMVDDVGNQQTSTLPYAPLRVDATGPSLALHSLAYPPGKHALRSGDYAVLSVQAQDASAITSVDIVDDSPKAMQASTSDTYYAQIHAAPGNGLQEVVVVARDAVGWESSLQVGVLVDNEAPQIIDASTDTDQPVRPGQELSFQILASDAHSGIASVLIDAGTLNVYAGTIEAFAPAQSNLYQAHVDVAAEPGTYIVPVHIHDHAGNTATQLLELVVHPPGPAITSWSLNGQPGLVTHEAHPFTVNATIHGTHTAELRLHREGGTNITQALEATGLASYTAAITKRLPPGAYTLRLFAVDEEGRNTTKTVQAAYVVDPDPPVISTFYADWPRGEDNASAAWFADPVSIHANASDQTRLTASLRIQASHGHHEEMPLEETGPGAWTSIANGQEPGTYTATLQVHDAAGNAATRSLEYQIQPRSDIQPGPVEDIHRTSSHQSPHVIVRWDSPVGGAVGYEAVLDGALVGRITSQEPTWIARAPVSPGPHELKVRAINNDGNWGPTTRLTFELGSTAFDQAHTEDPSARPRLLATPLPVVARTPPELSWEITDPAGNLQCVEVAWRTTGGYRILDPCIHGRKTRLDSLPLDHGDVVSIRARAIHKDDTVGDWLDLGTTRIDTQDPDIGPLQLIQEPTGDAGTLLVDVTVQDDSTWHATLQLHRHGVLVHNASVPGDGRVAVSGVAPGHYAVRVVATDAAGNMATAEAPDLVVGPSAARDDARWLAMAAAPAVIALLLGGWVWRRRRPGAKPSAAGWRLHLDGRPVDVELPREDPRGPDGDDESHLDPW